MNSSGREKIEEIFKVLPLIELVESLIPETSLWFCTFLDIGSHDDAQSTFVFSVLDKDK